MERPQGDLPPQLELKAKSLELPLSAVKRLRPQLPSS